MKAFSSLVFLAERMKVMALSAMFIFFSMNLVAQDSTAASPAKMLNRPAEFPGGMSGFLKYVRQNVKRLEGEEPNVKGKVCVMLEVGEDGELDKSSVRAVPLAELREKFKSIKEENIIANPAYEKEAVRLVKSNQRWTPAMENGKPVRRKMMIQVIF
jgi:hypothetical protein